MLMIDKKVIVSTKKRSAMSFGKDKIIPTIFVRQTRIPSLIRKASSSPRITELIKNL